MRIAFFTDSYLPQRDGVVSTIVGVRRELERMGHEVYVFAAGSRKDKRENADSKAYYHTSAPFRPYPDYRIAIFPFRDAERVRRHKIDIVHTHGMASMGLAAFLISKSMGLPLAGTFHTLVPEATHYISRSKTVRKVGKGLAWRYLRWYYNQCDRVVAPSAWLSKTLEQNGIGNVSVIHPGIDVRRFTPGAKGKAFRKAHGLGNSPVVLAVGRVALEKNLDVLVRSAMFVLEEIPDCKFVIVGRGPAEKTYKEMVKGAGAEGAFVFTGFVPDEELPQAYAAADVLAFPSTFETLGLVALEAMACGLPVACADHGPFREFVRQGRNGVLFDPGNPERCAEAIVRVYKARRRMGSEAVRTARKYDVRRCTRNLVALYEKMIYEAARR